MLKSLHRATKGGGSGPPGPPPPLWIRYWVVILVSWSPNNFPGQTVGALRLVTGRLLMLINADLRDLDKVRQITRSLIASITNRSSTLHMFGTFGTPRNCTSCLVHLLSAIARRPPYWNYLCHMICGGQNGGRQHAGPFGSPRNIRLTSEVSVPCTYQSFGSPRKFPFRARGTK